VSSCNEETDQCSTTPADAGTPCDEFFCRVGEACDGAGHCDDSTGTAYNCADDVACTTDGCSEETDECTHLEDHSQCSPPRSICDPDDPGHDARGCVAGRPCPGGTDAECDDGQFCNGAETCVSRICAPGTEPTCDDERTCTTDSCNPDASSGEGACEFSASDAACDDSLDCTTDSCAPEAPGADGTTGCLNASVTCASDDNPCTEDTCTEAHGGCYPPASTATSCEGTFACRTGETCDGAGYCDPASGTAVSCPDDSDLCTQDVCTEVFGGCYEPEASGFSCEGTFPCRTGETCNDSGVCVPTSGTPVTCTDDSNPCTTDVCDEAFGGCYPPEAAGFSCEGVLPCRTGETCDDAGTCDPASGTAITDCTAGDGCCPGGCVNPPDTDC
jgi:hypothetical protein